MKGDGPRPGNRYIGSFYEMTYQEFLQSKVELAPSSGFEVAACISLADMVIITAVLISTSKVDEFRIGGRDE